MEECGCMECVSIGGKKAIYAEGYNIEGCPCKNCLVKVLCDLICPDVIAHCDAHENTFMIKKVKEIIL